MTMTMTDPLRRTESAMDPPENRKATHYDLGDPGKPIDMVDAHDIQFAVAQLRPNDPCFVLRSGGRYTFARVISRRRIGVDIHIELQVDGDGATKTIPLHHCAQYVRPMRLTLTDQQKQTPQPQYPPRRHRNTAVTRSSTSLPHGGFQRRDSQNQPSLSKSHTGGRPSAERRQSSCQTGLNPVQKPSIRRRATLNASLKPNQNSEVLQCLRHYSAVRRNTKTREDEQARRPSSIASRVEDTLLTCPAKLEVHCDPETSSNSKVSVSESVELAYSSTSSSSTEEPHHSPTRPGLLSKNEKNSMKTVSLPRGFGDIQFNEEFLKRAFHSIDLDQ